MLLRKFIKVQARNQSLFHQDLPWKSHSLTTFIQLASAVHTNTAGGAEKLTEGLAGTTTENPTLRQTAGKKAIPVECTGPPAICAGDMESRSPHRKHPFLVVEGTLGKNPHECQLS